MNREASARPKAQHEAFRFNETQGVVTGYTAPQRPDRPYDRAKARRLLKAALPQLAVEDWTVRIDLGDGDPILVAAHSGTATMSKDNPGARTGCTLKTTAKLLISVLRRENLPRRALTRDDIKADGDVKLATRFCDALGGRRIVTNKVPATSALPSPTTDWDLAKDQLDEFGYAIIKDAMALDQVKSVRDRLMEQAEAEREMGVACLQGGDLGSLLQPNQRVWNLYNKGHEFLELLDHPIIEAFVPDYLGDYYLLSNLTANIAGPGGKPMFPHTDQTHVPADFPIGMNVFWFLEDVTAANGGTRLLPGSHRPDVGLDDIYSIDEMVAAEGPAGSAFLFDARLWHATGPNTAADSARPIIIMLFGRFWERQIDNLAVSVHDEVLATMSDRVKTMCGLRVTYARGTVEGQPFGSDGTIINRRHRGLGVLRPSRRTAE